MLWIALAVGSVLGVGVFLAIKAFSWSTEYLRSRHGRLGHGNAVHRPVLPEMATPEEARRAAALRSVDDIKQDMGELRTDVLWSITNSALWDVAVPASRNFFTALTVWDDQRANWPVAEVVHAAAELKVLWKAAIDTATRLGINHLPSGDRARAGTALKLVRKAASTTSDAERHQLMTKAAEVLSGIVSITIPRETMREIERGATQRELTDREDPPPTQLE